MAALSLLAGGSAALLLMSCARTRPSEAPRPLEGRGEPAATAVGGLRARLLPLKDEYLPNESLRMLFYLTNVSADPWREATMVDCRLQLFAGLRVHIVDAGGQPVRYHNWNLYATLVPVRREEFVAIRPGCSWGREFSEANWDVAISRPGTYQVYATFESQEDGKQFGLHAWTGKLVSDKVRLTVLPTPREARAR